MDIINQMQRGKLSLCCEDCDAPAMSAVVIHKMTESVPTKLTYSRGGFPKLGDRIIHKDLQCANCSAWVLKLNGGFNPNNGYVTYSSIGAVDPNAPIQTAPGEAPPPPAPVEPEINLDCVRIAEEQLAAGQTITHAAAIELCQIIRRLAKSRGNAIRRAEALEAEDKERQEKELKKDVKPMDGPTFRNPVPPGPDAGSVAAN